MAITITGSRVSNKGLFSRYNPQLWILFAGWVVSAMGFAMVIPFISIYFNLELGVPMTIVGGFFFVTAVIRALSQVIAGTLSDMFGRKIIMVFAQFFRSLVFFGVAFSIQHRAGFWITAAILVLGYLLASFFQPVANAMVSDIVPVNQRTEAYGLLRVSANVGWGIGPALGGFLAKHSYASLFWVGGILAIISGTTILLFIRESNPVEKRKETRRTHPGFSTAFHDKKFMIFCLFTLATFLTMAQLISTLSIYSKRWLGFTNPQLGWIYSANAFTVVLLQLWISRIISGRNLYLSLSLGSLMYGLGYSLMAFPNSFLWVLLLIVFITIAEMIVGPSAATMVSIMAPRNKYGLYMGTFGLFGTFGWSSGPFIGGILLDHISSPILLWSTVSSFGFIGALGFLWMNGKYPEFKRKV